MSNEIPPIEPLETQLDLPIDVTPPKNPEVKELIKEVIQINGVPKTELGAKLAGTVASGEKITQKPVNPPKPRAEKKPAPVAMSQKQQKNFPEPRLKLGMVVNRRIGDKFAEPKTIDMIAKNTDGRKVAIFKGSNEVIPLSELFEAKKKIIASRVEQPKSVRQSFELPKGPLEFKAGDLVKIAEWTEPKKIDMLAMNNKGEPVAIFKGEKEAIPFSQLSETKKVTATTRFERPKADKTKFELPKALPFKVGDSVKAANWSEPRKIDILAMNKDGETVALFKGEKEAIPLHKLIAFTKAEKPIEKPVEKISAKKIETTISKEIGTGARVQWIVDGVPQFHEDGKKILSVVLDGDKNRIAYFMGEKKGIPFSQLQLIEGAKVSKTAVESAKAVSAETSAVVQTQAAESSEVDQSVLSHLKKMQEETVAPSEAVEIIPGTSKIEVKTSKTRFVDYGSGAEVQPQSSAIQPEKKAAKAAETKKTRERKPRTEEQKLKRKIGNGPLATQEEIDAIAKEAAKDAKERLANKRGYTPDETIKGAIEKGFLSSLGSVFGVQLAYELPKYFDAQNRKRNAEKATNALLDTIGKEKSKERNKGDEAPDTIRRKMAEMNGRLRDVQLPEGEKQALRDGMANILREYRHAKENVTKKRKEKIDYLFDTYANNSEQLMTVGREAVNTLSVVTFSPWIRAFGYLGASIGKTIVRAANKVDQKNYGETVVQTERQGQILKELTVGAAKRTYGGLTAFLRKGEGETSGDKKKDKAMKVATSAITLAGLGFSALRIAGIIEFEHAMNAGNAAETLGREKIFEAIKNHDVVGTIQQGGSNMWDNAKRILSHIGLAKNPNETMKEISGETIEGSIVEKNSPGIISSDQMQNLSGTAKTLGDFSIQSGIAAAGIAATEKVGEHAGNVAEHLSSGVENLAIIHKNEGIEHSLIRQLEAHAKDFGYKGDVDNQAALHHFAQIEAHKIAIDEGYVNVENGTETRVNFDPKNPVEYILHPDRHVEYKGPALDSVYYEDTSGETKKALEEFETAQKQVEEQTAEAAKNLASSQEVPPEIPTLQDETAKNLSQYEMHNNKGLEYLYPSGTSNHPDVQNIPSQVEIDNALKADAELKPQEEFSLDTGSGDTPLENPTDDFSEVTNTVEAPHVPTQLEHDTFVQSMNEPLKPLPKRGFFEWLFGRNRSNARTQEVLEKHAAKAADQPIETTHDMVRAEQHRSIQDRFNEATSDLDKTQSLISSLESPKGTFADKIQVLNNLVPREGKINTAGLTEIFHAKDDSFSIRLPGENPIKLNPSNYKTILERFKIAEEVTKLNK